MSNHWSDPPSYRKNQKLHCSDCSEIYYPNQVHTCSSSKYQDYKKYCSVCNEYYDPTDQITSVIHVHSDQRPLTPFPNGLANHQDSIPSVDLDIFKGNPFKDTPFKEPPAEVPSEQDNSEISTIPVKPIPVRPPPGLTTKSNSPLSTKIVLNQDMLLFWKRRYDQKRRNLVLFLRQEEYIPTCDKNEENFEDSYRIFLKNTYTFESFEQMISDQQTVLSLKLKISQKMKCPFDWVRLIVKGKQLLNKHLLRDYHLKEDQIIFMVMSPSPK